MTLVIEITVECPHWKELGDLGAFAAQSIDAALQETGDTPAEGAELSFLFCDDARICELNRQFSGKDKPTNVLSFPTSEPMDSARCLGDIALAHGTIAREADEQGKSLDHHSRHMIVHGFLHLLGYNHEDEADAKAMEALEVRILKRLGVENPYSENDESESQVNGRF